MTKPGTYNGEDRDCLCCCARCGEELTSFHRGKRAHWLAKDTTTGQWSRKHVDRDGSAGGAKWSPFGATCAKRTLEGN